MKYKYGLFLFLLACIPVLGVFLTGRIFPIQQHKKDRAPYQPPGWVFSVVWTYVTFALGLVWVLDLSRTLDKLQSCILPFLLVSFWCAWIINESYFPPPSFTIPQKVTSSVLLITSGVLLCLFTMYSRWYVGKIAYILTPGIVWLFLATSLNGYTNNKISVINNKQTE